jgi:hypothetical protein
MIKNIYGAKVLIPYGDWEPTAIWHFWKIETNPDIGKVGVTGADDYDDFGLFTKETYQKILAEIAQHAQENKWLPHIEKWLPNHMVDKCGNDVK